jgi:hypothetical protein
MKHEASLTQPCWPEQLSDEEALLRLQAILLAACEGNQDLANGRAYRSLRSPLLRRADLSQALPKYIRAHKDLGSFWMYIRAHSSDWEARRQHGLETLQPMFDQVQLGGKPKVASAAWTGRRTAAQQAQIVRSLVPAALDGVESLIAEQEHALHNGGPADAERAAALQALRSLHAALGELISFAEAGKPLRKQLARVRELKGQLFSWSNNPYGLALGELPLTGMTTVLGCGVAALINLITKNVEASATIGAASSATFAAAALQRRTKATLACDLRRSS